MYFIGWMAFFQITFLPGFLLLSFLQIKIKTLLEKIIFIFSFSLIVNYLLVFLLVITKLYQPVFVYLIFAVEMVIFFLTINNQQLSINFYIPNRQRIFTTLITLTHQNLGIVGIVIGVVFFRFLLLFFQNLSLKSVFLTGDALDSWNVWARAWATNKIPLLTYHYPQLIPANWSLTYIFMQNSMVEYFAKLLMPLFSIGILLIFFDLSKQTKKISYIFALIITAGLFHYYFDGSFLRDGYPDIAFAFFAFLPFYCWILFQKTKNFQYVFLSIIFALASFLTKQLGIYIVLLATISPTRWYLALPSKPKRCHFWLFFIFLLVVITFGWYLYKIPEIVAKAFDIENTYHLATKNVYRGQPLVLRFFQSWQVLAPNIKGVFIVVMVSLLSLLSLTEKLSRRLFFFLILPLFLFWTMFLNYDVRNLAVIFPYLGYTGAIGLEKLLPLQLFKYLNNHSNYRKISFSIYYFIFVFIFLITIAGFFVNNRYLLRQQNEGKKQIGIPELNSRLYDYYYKNGFTGKIATSYYRLCNLPEIGKYCLYTQFNDVTPLRPGVKYLLYPEKEFQPVNNRRKIIFSFQGWRLSR